MIHTKIRIEDIDKARKSAEKLGCLYGSITNGGGNLFGFVGEIIVKRYLKVTNSKSSQDFDLTYHGVTLDVKTKRVTSEPKPEYECSITASNIKQNCDFYFFTRVHENLIDSWLLGFISKRQFMEKARFCIKGEVDSKSDRGWTFKADCYNLPISELILDPKLIYSK